MFVALRRTGPAVIRITLPEGLHGENPSGRLIRGSLWLLLVMVCRASLRFVALRCASLRFVALSSGVRQSEFRI